MIDFYRMTVSIIFRSQKDYDNSTVDELTVRAERTLSDFYADCKKSKNM